jgi:hypothetical protein
VTERIVDDLEVVEIQVKHRQHPWVAAEPADALV